MNTGNKNNKSERQSIFSKNKKEYDLSDIPASLSKDNLEKIEQEINEPKKSLLKNKKSLEDLIFLGRAEKIVNISDFTFKIQTLTNNEQKEVIFHISKALDEEKMFVLRTLTLAFSVREINGVSLDDFIGSDSIDEKIIFFNKLSSSLVNELFKVYSEILEESDNSIKAKEIKN